MANKKTRESILNELKKAVEDNISCSKIYLEQITETMKHGNADIYESGLVAATNVILTGRTTRIRQIAQKYKKHIEKC